MKVCTDACIFGAYVDVNNATQILDIGAGTGLLSLMIAQRCKAHIIGIEIDVEAAAQAQINLTNSNWGNRLKIINESVQRFTQNTTQKYDVIVSNPPFFQNNLLSPVVEKNIAKHDQNLTLTELANCVATLLAHNSLFWVMLPYYEMNLLEKIMNDKKLYCQSELSLRTKAEQGQIFRVIKSFSFSRRKYIIKHVEIIHSQSNEYTEWFKGLLKDYYLNF